MMQKKPFVTKEQIEEIVKTDPTPFHIYDEKGSRETVSYTHLDVYKRQVKRYVIQLCQRVAVQNVGD